MFFPGLPGKSDLNFLRLVIAQFHDVVIWFSLTSFVPESFWPFDWNRSILRPSNYAAGCQACGQYGTEIQPFQ